jgi:hypothetical protein
VGSLKLGWMTASLFISKLLSFARQNALEQALQEDEILNRQELRPLPKPELA